MFISAIKQSSNYIAITLYIRIRKYTYIYCVENAVIVILDTEKVHQ